MTQKSSKFSHLRGGNQWMLPKKCLFCWSTNPLIDQSLQLLIKLLCAESGTTKPVSHSQRYVPTVLTFVEKSMNRNADRMQMKVPWASVMWCTVWLFGILSMLAEADHPLRRRCPQMGHYYFTMYEEYTLIHIFISPSYITFSHFCK